MLQMRLMILSDKCEQDILLYLVRLGGDLGNPDRRIHGMFFIPLTPSSTPLTPPIHPPTHSFISQPLSIL